MADDKNNIPDAGKVDEPPSQERWRLSKPISRCRTSALAKVEIPKDKDAPAPSMEGAPQPGKDEKRTTIPGMGDYFFSGKAVDFTLVGDRAAKGR